MNVFFFLFWLGFVILESVLLVVFRCFYRECGSYIKRRQERREGGVFSKSWKLEEERDERIQSEFIKIFNLLFGVFESYFIWDYVVRMFEAFCQKCVSFKRVRRINFVQETDISVFFELCIFVEYLLDIIFLVSFFFRIQISYIISFIFYLVIRLINIICNELYILLLQMCVGFRQFIF